MGSPDVPFPEYAPDLTTLATKVTDTAFNVIPQGDGYGPFQDLQEFAKALPAANRGFFFARNGDSTISVFAGTANRLYKLDNATLDWLDMSKGGVAYADLVSTSNWRFAQFNDFVVAVQVNTVPQKFVLSTPAVPFVDLGGSPPQAGHIAIVNRFIVLTSLLSNPRRVQWSDLDAPETWTAGVGLADYQDLPDGGSVFSLSGGDAYGLIFQNESIRSLTYAPGSPTTFQIARVSTQETLFAEYSVVNAGERTFFITASGFNMVVSGGKPEDVGIGRVNKTFFRDVDRSALQLVIGAADPTNKCVMWAYKSQQGLTGLFDRIILYHYGFNKWALITGIVGEYLAPLAKPGLTLEQLDEIAPTPLDVLGAADNGSGAIRLTLNALSNADFNIVGQNFIVVYGVEGTEEANGTWNFTVIDPTHIDLIGSTFTNAYTTGGHIGGSLDALPFSLDTVAKSSIAALAVFNMIHQLAFFTGQNLEATIVTQEQDLGGDTGFISGVRPMTDAVNVGVTVGTRFGPGQTITWLDEEITDDTGFAGNLAEARYMRAKVRIPAGSEWTYARSVQPEVQLAGEE